MESSLKQRTCLLCLSLYSQSLVHVRHSNNTRRINEWIIGWLLPGAVDDLRNSNVERYWPPFTICRGRKEWMKKKYTLNLPCLPSGSWYLSPVAGPLGVWELWEVLWLPDGLAPESPRTTVYNPQEAILSFGTSPIFLEKHSHSSFLSLFWGRMVTPSMGGLACSFLGAWFSGSPSSPSLRVPTCHTTSCCSEAANI